MISPEAEIAYTTFGDLVTKVQKINAPEGVGEIVRIAYNNYVVNALIKAQRYIDCLRSIQVNFYCKNHAVDHCGVSTIAVGPRGKINAVYAFKPGKLCRKYHYKNTTPQFISCWSLERSCNWTEPNTEAYMYGYDLCYPYFGTDQQEDDSRFTCGDCGEKYYARGQAGELYLAPRFPCGYLIAVHWEGLRRHWNNWDAVPDDPDLIDWIATYVQQELSIRNDRDPNMYQAMVVEERTKFADLMYWCNEERKIRVKLDCTQGIDTGLLSQMFQPIYPLPTQDCTPPQAQETPPTPPVVNDILTDSNGDPVGFPNDTFQDYGVGSNSGLNRGYGWDGAWDLQSWQKQTVVAYDDLGGVAPAANLNGVSTGQGFSGPWEVY